MARPACVSLRHSCPSLSLGGPGPSPAPALPSAKFCFRLRFSLVPSSRSLWSPRPQPQAHPLPRTLGPAPSQPPAHSWGSFQPGADPALLIPAPTPLPLSPLCRGTPEPEPHSTGLPDSHRLPSQRAWARVRPPASRRSFGAQPRRCHHPRVRGSARRKRSSPSPAPMLSL